MDFTNYLADKLVNVTVRNIGYSAPAKVYLALFKTNPTKNVPLMYKYDDGTVKKMIVIE